MEGKKKGKVVTQKSQTIKVRSRRIELKLVLRNINFF